MEKQLKEIIRSVVREDFMNEMSKNDIHVKEIMKFYDKGTYSTKKAVSIFVSGKTNANRNQILDDLGDMGYNEIWDVMDHFKLKLESANEAAVPTGERIQNLNNRIKALRDKLSATKSPEQKKLFQDRLKNALQTLSNIKKDYSIKKESTLNEGFGDSIKKIRNLAIKMASTKYDRAKSHLKTDKIASTDDFKGTDAMNKATAALLQQKDLDEDLKSAINKIAVKLGAGSTMMGIITALVSLSGWIQYLDASFTKWYYTEIQHLAEPEVMKVMQDMGKAGQAEGSIYGKFGMYAFFIFFTIAVISLVAAKMTRDNKNEYVDKKGVEHVAAALPQTEEEPIKECKTC
jgi:hypothetical protein